MNGSPDSKFLARLSVYLITLAAIYIACVTFLTIPKDNVPNANLILGFVLGTLLGTVIAFNYGSSKTSQTKDATISALSGVPTLTDVVTPEPTPQPRV